MLGVVNSLAFDGVLEFQSEAQNEAGSNLHAANILGEYDENFLESTTSNGFLAASLTYLVLGTRTLLTVIKKLSVEKKDKIKESLAIDKRIR